MVALTVSQGNSRRRSKGGQKLRGVRGPHSALEARVRVRTPQIRVPGTELGWAWESGRGWMNIC